MQFSEIIADISNIDIGEGLNVIRIMGLTCVWAKRLKSIMSFFLITQIRRTEICLGIICDINRLTLNKRTLSMALLSDHFE